MNSEICESHIIIMFWLAITCLDPLMTMFIDIIYIYIYTLMGMCYIINEIYKFILKKNCNMVGYIIGLCCN